MTVKIGSFVCGNVDWLSSGRIQCTVPPGAGEKLNLSIAVSY